MGTPVKSYGIGGRGCLDIGKFLPFSGSGIATLQIRDVSDVSTHREDAGRISPPHDTPTDRKADETESGMNLVLISTEGGDGRGGI